ncbi:MAG TPA: hypothetical protein VFU15_11265, partial [Bacteroidia bacterium]|nr:hypothetical protein [Bacteroidia bacterium]
GNNRKAAEYSSSWEKTGDMPAALLPYAFNVLQSVPQDAVLLTNGEFDTFPLCQQQYANNVRPDVKLLCISFAQKSSNRAMLFRNAGLTLPGNDSTSAFDAAFIMRVVSANPGKKIYLASTVSGKILAALQGDLYCTGLAFRYGDSPVNNLDFLKDNVGTKMDLACLSKPPESKGVFDSNVSAQLNMNYVLPLTLAAKQYSLAGNTAKAEELNALARSIGKAAGKEKTVNELIGG